MTRAVLPGKARRFRDGNLTRVRVDVGIRINNDCDRVNSF